MADREETSSELLERSGDCGRPVRLVYVVSHPIQYQAPLLRLIAQDPGFDLFVLFCSDFSVRSYSDPGFGVSLEWDVPLTDGYRHTFLPRWRDSAHTRFFSPISRGFFRAMRSAFNGHKPDCVWVHGYSTLNALHAMLAAAILRTPVLVRAEPWLNDRPRSRRRKAVKQIFFRALRPFVRAVLPIGTRNAVYWQRAFGQDFPAFLFPYAVDNDFFAERTREAGPARDALRAELNLQPGRQVILFASKLQKRKCCDDLLSAYLHLIRDQVENTAPYLLIVGSGEEQPALERRVASLGIGSVRFAGFRNQRELPRFFDLANVFVLPSRYEPWGLVVNEAMAAGLPVIVSDEVGSGTDLVSNGENGFIFKAGDIALLTEALRQTLAPGVAEAMGQRSRERIHRWGFAEDIAGLRAAVRFAIGPKNSRAATTTGDLANRRGNG